MRLERAFFREIKKAEAARVVEADRDTIFEDEDNVIMSPQRLIGVASDHHATRHAEMADHRPAVIQPDQDIFRPSADDVDPASFDPLAQSFGKRETEVGSVQVQADKASSIHDMGKPPAYGFDFWQFGHGRFRCLDGGMCCDAEPRAV